MQKKIFQLTQLSGELEKSRAASKRIVHCHGVFDLLHIGHIRHFEEARSFGDILVVTITADPFVNKGPTRPAFSENLRAESIAALECVDYVSINSAESAVPAIQVIRPNFYVKGKEYRDRPKARQGKLKLEEDTVKECGGEIVYTDDITFSSSSLINSHMSNHPAEVVEYLSALKQKFPAEHFEGLFDKIRDLKVLVVGETIIDQYHYCESIGKAGKEPVLVAKSFGDERFVGGNLAIANHIAGFCNEVALVSMIGSQEGDQQFIASHMKANVKLNFIQSTTRPTIVKLRYVEQYLLQKLFELYVIEDEPLGEDEEAELCTLLADEISKYDVVVVADYGHGMLTDKTIGILTEQSNFLAVNTQANAGNRGFHTISHYPKADYVSLSEGELRLDLRKRKGDPVQMVKEVMSKCAFKTMTVTKGKYGLFTSSRDGQSATSPAMTQHVVDRVGSGDAVLAITSLLAAVGAKPEEIAFVGNVAGAEAVRIVGHRSFLEYPQFIKHVKALLK